MCGAPVLQIIECLNSTRTISEMASFGTAAAKSTTSAQRGDEVVDAIEQYAEQV